MVMSQDWSAGQSHNIKTDNSSLKGWKSSKYFGTAITNQNSIQEEIKSMVKSGNTCYHSVQNLLSSSLLSKNMKIKIYLLAQWSRVRLEKVIISQLVKNFPAFYRARSFITLKCPPPLPILSTSIQSMPSHPTSLRSITKYCPSIYV